MSVSTWIVGDVHGCRRTLSRLLERVGIDLGRDRLVLVGDLVNRGPASLDVLRWAMRTERESRGGFDVILGNHDLQLLALALGLAKPRPSDTLSEVLAAPDRDELVAWLARRPLAIAIGDALIVHAGVAPSWTVEDTLERAERASAALRGPHVGAILQRRTERGREIRSNLSAIPTDLSEIRSDIATLTRVRMIDQEGALSPYSGHPHDAPPGLTPWFDAPHRRTSESTVVFGHWAALGLYVEEGLYGLDTGCSWGRRLTAMRLEDGALVHQEVAKKERPPRR